ncbi:hypothetical protein AB0B27_09890 [Micromonospora rifamycinica]|uniref:hypothetical protein n=1 Tax=Micromonospora rifamycinica TaxID=291594 RepID=UPI0033E952E4
MSRQTKPGDKAYRTGLRGRLTALGVTDEHVPAWVARDLILECRLRPRTAWRLASELSLEMAAHRYNVVHGDPRAGMRGSRIWEYEKWPDRGVRPTLPTLRILAQVYGTECGSLIDLRDLESLRPKELAEYRSVLQDIPAVSQPAAVARRSWGSPAADPHPDGEVLAEAVNLTKTNVDDVQLEDLWSEMNSLGDAYPRTSPASVLRQLSVMRARLSTLIEGRQRPKQARDLYLLSAKCCAMMAWTAADLGRYDLAQELNSAAWLYGSYADDQLARRQVRSSQARVAYWAGNGVESARLAADGLRYRVNRSVTDLPLILAEARGWAGVQAERQVLDAIGRWSRIEDTDLTVADEDRFFNISKDRRHYMAGTSLLSVGRTDLALAELRTAREAHRMLPPEQRWEAMELMIQIDTGRAYLRLGELDGAAEELESFLEADVGPRPDMVRSMLRVVTTELASFRWHGSAMAQALFEALLDVCTSF